MQHDLQTERMAASNAIVAMLKGEPAERDRAAWVAIREVVRGLAHDTPRALGYPAVLHGVTTEELKAAIALASDEQSAIAAAFFAYRGALIKLEYRNAGRLGVLVGTLRRIAALRKSPHLNAEAHEGLDRFEAALTTHLRRAWGVTELPPAGTDMRAWPVAFTRRYDLLPLAWRSL